MFLKTSPSSSYFTFARGGYIINIKPIAMGIFVVPLWNEFQNLVTPGKKYPDKIPDSMDKNIHNVK
jgi:hypothetical protein